MQPAVQISGRDGIEVTRGSAAAAYRRCIQKSLRGSERPAVTQGALQRSTLEISELAEVLLEFVRQFAFFVHFVQTPFARTDTVSIECRLVFVQ